MDSASPTAADAASLSTSDATGVANTFPVGQNFDAEFRSWQAAPAPRRPRYRRPPHHPTATGEAAS